MSQVKVIAKPRDVGEGGYHVGKISRRCGPNGTGERHCQIEAEPVHMHLGHQIAPWASRWVEHDCASRHGPASTKPLRWASRVLGGMPGWQIVLIAADSALLACALTLLAVRLARRTTPAQPSHP